MMMSYLPKKRGEVGEPVEGLVRVAKEDSTVALKNWLRTTTHVYCKND